jgi:uncharacterized membrane protein required for colicin V production
MKTAALPIGVFDFALLIFLVIGFVRGRRRGMSQEMMDLFMWLGMVAGASFGYKELGRLMASKLTMDPVTANMIAYVGCALAVAFIFVVIKNAMKDKMAGSDLFGRLEYPLGILSGMIRFFCLVLMAMSLLGARLISKAETDAAVAAQVKDLGSQFFPVMGQIQDDVLVKSFTGPYIRKHLSFAFIEPMQGKGEVPASGPDKPRLKDRYDGVIPK